MTDFERKLSVVCKGRVCVLGVGNADLGDDAVGMVLAEAIRRQNLPDVEVILAGSEPERFVGRVREGSWNNVLLLDALAFGGPPGAIALLNASEINSRFPQCSVHKMGLGLLARYVEFCGATRAWLLGVQPATFEPRAGLSASVAKSVQLLADRLSAALNRTRVSVP